MKKQLYEFAKAQYQTPCIAAFDVEVERVIASSLEGLQDGGSLTFDEQ